MIKRQARQGKFAGRFFYGCTRYPNCKGIVNIDSATQHVDSYTPKISIDTRPYTDTSLLKFPVHLHARPRASGLKTLFYDSLALPNSLLSAVNNESIDRNLLSHSAKWRVDFVPSQNSLDDSLLSVVSVLEKTINRGVLTRLPEDLELKIFKKLKLTDTDVYDQHIVLDTYRQSYSPHVPSQWLDGEKRHSLDNMTAEEYFYKNILLDTIGINNISDVLPQVSFRSLAIANTDKIDNALLNQRVDFLVTHNSKTIVIEVDDPTHSNHLQRDDSRDRLLEENGLETYRVDVNELVNNSGAGLDRVKAKLYEMYKDDQPTNKIYPGLRAVNIAHNFQLLLIGLLKEGKIDLNQQTKIFFDPSNIPSMAASDLHTVLDASLEDLTQLDKAMSELYGSKQLFSSIQISDNDPDLIISVNDNHDYDQHKMVYIQRISYPLNLAQNTYSHINYIKPSDDVKILKYLLNYIFRFDDFRPKQIDGIVRSINGMDSIVLLPTGSGKSIVYQLLSFVLPGMAIIVDPLVSLIEDQVDNLRRAGIDRIAGITAGTDNKDKVQQSLSEGLYSMVYVSPERFQIDGFRNCLTKYCADKTISVCAIDEAHCVSEWGHDFRTSYLNLAQTCRRLLRSGLRTPPILALTGTASESVLRDMERDLKIDDSSVIRPDSFDRKEIEFLIFNAASHQKSDVLRDILEIDLPSKFRSTARTFYLPQGEDTMSGIVFCMHVGGSFGVKSVMKDIKSLGINSREYFGQQTHSTRTMSDEEWNKTKRQNAADFKNNKFSVLTSTKSFGMGVDKPNIRFTIHYGLPQSIESYYQEAGRAGRDRKQAYSYIIVSNDFLERNNQLLSPLYSLDELTEFDSRRKKSEDDDITRALWFHTNSFKGIDKELQTTANILDSIGDLTRDKQVNITVSDTDRERAEKSIYRLLILGVVKDYTINFANNEFMLEINSFSRDLVASHYAEYVRGYQDDEDYVSTAKQKILSIHSNEAKGFVVESMRILLEDFIYKIIENSRRRAFSNLVSITDEASKIPIKSERSKLIRKRILEFLGNTYVDVIKSIVDNPGDLNNVEKIVKSIKGKQRDSLYAELGRTLQAYPEHPGLLLAHQVLQLETKTYDVEAVINTLFAIIKYAASEYSLESALVLRKIVWSLSYSEKSDYDTILNGLIVRMNSSDFNQMLIDLLPDDKKHIPYTIELSEVTSELINNVGKEELWTASK